MECSACFAEVQSHSRIFWGRFQIPELDSNLPNSLALCEYLDQCLVSGIQSNVVCRNLAWYTSDNSSRAFWKPNQPSNTKRLWHIFLHHTSTFRCGNLFPVFLGHCYLIFLDSNHNVLLQLLWSVLPGFKKWLYARGIKNATSLHQNFKDRQWTQEQKRSPFYIIT